MKTEDVDRIVAAILTMATHLEGEKQERDFVKTEVAMNYEAFLKIVRRIESEDYKRIKTVIEETK